MKLYVFQNSLLLYLYFYTHSLFFILITIDNLYSLREYLLNNSHPSRRLISFYNIYVPKISYNQHYHIRVIYYIGFYITSILLDYIFYFSITLYIKFTITLLSIPTCLNYFIMRFCLT